MADDPGLYSSQNEQDTRMVARAAQLPVIEPSDSAEAKDFVKMAYEISEDYDTPCIFEEPPDYPFPGSCLLEWENG